MSSGWSSLEAKQLMLKPFARVKSFRSSAEVLIVPRPAFGFLDSTWIRMMGRSGIGSVFVGF